MTKAEEKRAAIIAQQAAREVAEGGAQRASGSQTGAGRAGKGRRRFAPTPTFSGQRRGTPPKPDAQ
jgi:hypothetical protein